MTAHENIPVQDATTPVITQDPAMPGMALIVISALVTMTIVIALMWLFRQKDWIAQLEAAGYLNIALEIWVAIIMITLSIPSTLYNPIWESEPITNIEILYESVSPVFFFTGATIVWVHLWIGLGKYLELTPLATIVISITSALIIAGIVYCFYVGI
jgi:hypothetical protein